MYRSPDRIERCPCCQSEELGPLTKFDPSEGNAHLHFARKDPTGGIFRASSETFAVDRARVCLACGHVMFFFSEGRLRQLKGRLPELEPMLG
ncbi:MAG: hypothetical protein U0234_13025 [Sandaracinus sp.]